jgi:hypothetical protein
MGYGGRVYEQDTPAAGDVRMGLDHRWLLIIPASFVLLLVIATAMGRKLTWKADPATLGLALLVIADASSFWSANNPSGFTVRSFSTEGGDKHDQACTDIQIGSVKAIGESAIIAIGASLLTGSLLPWAAQAVYLLGDWFYYDWALNNPHAGTGIAQQAA